MYRSYPPDRTECASFTDSGRDANSLGHNQVWCLFSFATDNGSLSFRFQRIIGRLEPRWQVVDQQIMGGSNYQLQRGDVLAYPRGHAESHGHTEEALKATS